MEPDPITHPEVSECDVLSFLSEVVQARTSFFAEELESETRRNLSLTSEAFNSLSKIQRAAHIGDAQRREVLERLGMSSKQESCLSKCPTNMREKLTRDYGSWVKKLEFLQAAHERHSPRVVRVTLDERDVFSFSPLYAGYPLLCVKLEGAGSSSPSLKVVHNSCRTDNGSGSNLFHVPSEGRPILEQSDVKVLQRVRDKAITEVYGMITVGQLKKMCNKGPWALDSPTRLFEHGVSLLFGGRAVFPEPHLEPILSVPLPLGLHVRAAQRGGGLHTTARSFKDFKPTILPGPDPKITLPSLESLSQEFARQREADLADLEERDTEGMFDLETQEEWAERVGQSTAEIVLVPIHRYFKRSVLGVLQRYTKIRAGDDLGKGLERMEREIRERVHH